MFIKKKFKITKILVSIRRAETIEIIGNKKDLIVKKQDTNISDNSTYSTNSILTFKVKKNKKFKSIKINLWVGDYVSLFWVEVYGK